MTRPWIERAQVDLEDWFADLPRRRMQDVGRLTALWHNRHEVRDHYRHALRGQFVGHYHGSTYCKEAH